MARDMARPAPWARERAFLSPYDVEAEKSGCRIMVGVPREPGRGRMVSGFEADVVVVGWWVGAAPLRWM